MAKSNFRTKLWEWQKSCREGQGECIKCGSKEGLTVDHIVPQSLLEHFGLKDLDDIQNCEDNFQILCGLCNAFKRNRMDFIGNPKTFPLLKSFVQKLENNLNNND